MMRCFDNRLPGVAPLPPPPERRNARRQLTRTEKQQATAAQAKCGCGSCLSLDRQEQGIRQCPACERRDAPHRTGDWWDETRRMYGRDLDDETLNRVAAALEEISDVIKYGTGRLVITIEQED
uniref:Uncharacterized protein n=1 Tax=Pseudomonas phage Cygsa01 TaxID=3138529 RepID=A0AAU6W3F5_9VIRU